jgi:diguanylate cyclase (GGDEF)-like protein
MSIRFLVAETLRQAGFEIEDAANGCQVLDAFKRLKPDIVILDATLPEHDGFSVCAEIRSLPYGITTPVVIMTGFDDIEAVKKAYNAGATDFIAKPINWPILSHRIMCILRSSRTIESLCLSQSRLAEAQLIAKIGTWELNMLTGEIYWSSEACRLFDSDSSCFDQAQKNFMNVMHPLRNETLTKSLQNAISSGTCYSIDQRISLRNGEECYIHSEARIQRDETGQPVWTVGYIQDITERKQYEKKIKHLAFFDNLTNLPNRTLFKDYFNHAMALAKRKNHLMGVLFIDLDRFKQINETLGHSVGDELLIQVSERLLTCVRKGDYVSRDVIDDADSDMDVRVARFAGDEFLILLENINDYYEAAKVAQRVIEIVSTPYPVHGSEISVTPSIGISIYPLDGDNLDDIIMHADIAMFHAKEMGRNNFQYYTDSLNTAAMTHLVLENQLRKVALRDEFTLFYQPMVDLDQGKVFSVEVLVRWQHTDLGDLQPDKFISLAEETGLITEIDEWVLMNSCRQAKLWQDSGLLNFKLSINLSGRHFRKRNLLETIDRVIQTTKVDPRCLELELTEGIFVNNDMDALSILHGLKQRGLQLSIDDFGTGYSSLSYLKRFPFDVLKIDRSFVKDIFTDPDSVSIISAIIAMAGSLKLEIIAEGVETKEQMTMLLENGCKKMQGFYFSPPLPAMELEEFIKEYSSRQYNFLWGNSRLCCANNCI